MYLLCHCHRSVSLENSLTQYHRSQCYFIVFPTQHKIIWAEMSPRYLFLLFSKQTNKKILIIKYLFYWQILPYFLRKFQNKVSIFTSMQHYNFFPVFSSGQGDFFAHHSGHQQLEWSKWSFPWKSTKIFVLQHETNGSLDYFQEMFSELSISPQLGAIFLLSTSVEWKFQSLTKPKICWLTDANFSLVSTSNFIFFPSCP